MRLDEFILLIRDLTWSRTKKNRLTNHDCFVFEFPQLPRRTEYRSEMWDESEVVLLCENFLMST